MLNTSKKQIHRIVQRKQVVKTLLRVVRGTAALFGFVIIAAFFTFAGFLVGRLSHHSPVAPREPLPSIRDIQRQVGAKPDGRLGPETQKKWDKAYVEQCARKYFK